MIIIDKLCYRSKLRYVSAAEKLLYAVSSLMICVLTLLCGGFDRIYRKWNFDGRKGEDSSFLLCSTADDSDRIFDRRNRSCFFKSIESSYGCICRAGRGNIYNGKP